MTDNNKDAETILKAIILRIESKGNRSFHDANMLQELRLVVEKLNEKMSQHKEEEIADKVANNRLDKLKTALTENIESFDTSQITTNDYIFRQFEAANNRLKEKSIEIKESKNTPKMSKIFDKKVSETCEKSMTKLELSIDSVYHHLLQDRAAIKCLLNNEQKAMMFVENTESITRLLMYKDEFACYENDIDY